MIPVDLHTHTTFSGCGLHSIIEMLSYAKELGMEAIAITDHCKLAGGNINSTFFNRLNNPVSGIEMFKGVEANPTGEDGNTDIPLELLQFMDIVLIGLHYNIKSGESREYYTDILIETLRKNRFIDIVTHPNSTACPVNYDRLAKEALNLGVSLELNNSKTMLGRVDDSETEELIKACKKNGCTVAVNSDAHAIHELGQNSSINRLIKKLDFPEELIVNSTAEKGFQFVEQCRNRKLLTS